MAASITVNNSRNSGSVSGTGSSNESKILKQILNELKVQNKQNMVTQRKQESGLIAGVAGPGILGIITDAIGISLGAILGPLTMLATTLTVEGANNPLRSSETLGFSFEKTELNGEVGYARIDSKTGDILDILTEQEAEQKKILDKNGELKSDFIDMSTTNKSIFGNMTKIGDSYQITAPIVADLLKNIISQETYDGEILAFKKQIRDYYADLATKLVGREESKLQAEGIITTSQAAPYVQSQISISDGERAMRNYFDTQKQTTQGLPLTTGWALDLARGYKK